MNKVSWPTRAAAYGCSFLVVLFSLLFLVAILWAYDFFWRLVLLHLLSVVS